MEVWTVKRWSELRWSELDSVFGSYQSSRLGKLVIFFSF